MIFDILFPLTTIGLSVGSDSALSVLQTRMQCRNALFETGKIDKPYTKPLNTTFRIWKNEGWKGFFKGFVPAILSKGIRNFLTWGNYRFKFQKHTKTKEMSEIQKMSLLMLTEYSFIFMISLATYPFDFARIRLINNGMIKGKEPQFTNMRDLGKKVWAQEGIRGFYRGMGASIIGIFAYRTCYKAVYQSLKVLKSQTYLFAAMLVSTMTTILVSLLVYPIDTVKKRMMMTSLEDSKYSGTWDCLRQIKTKEGWKSLYHGLSVKLFQNLSGSFILSAHDKVRSKMYY